MQGSGHSIVRTVSASLAAAGPVIFGVIGDNGYFDQEDIALAVTMAVVIALTFWIPVNQTLRPPTVDRTPIRTVLLTRTSDFPYRRSYDICCCRIE
ncbi:major facilitator superfamily protein [Natrialba chahannaoensis JCM 10990]|uniref:Major facilitator superfamily protein n=1 Tax=Natrialba chahannaoensis JCM 10990 TaxID=1227492 RepID=M0ACN4_9EURY|nr:major facilitator superfamily protein [Natrialba chahannaoensis JCM 10990]